MRSSDDVSVTSLDEAKMSSTYDDTDDQVVYDDDAKSYDAGNSGYNTYDDDNYDDDGYEYDDRDDELEEVEEDGDDEAISPLESRSYPEPEHYPEMEPQYHYQPKKKKKKVYIPVFVPDKEKKKSKLNKRFEL